MKTDTITAIATAMSNAGISIIRISGEEALSIINQIYQSKNGKKKLFEVASHTAHYGYIVDNNIVIDEVIVLIMKAPNSYTKEDIVEIHCHGGIIVTKKILELVIQHGARVAEPGEFTKRAFLNGRLDLSQAEAVIDIINAKNEYALNSSVQQLRGVVLNKIREIRDNIILDIAFIEAALDDPEHISLEGFDIQLMKNMDKDEEELKLLIKSSENGKFLREGIRTVIVGKPNVGKSSLLNVLLGEERAIVTEIAGTTRDTLEECIHLNGIILNIIDTAGIRQTQDIVEQIGIERAKECVQDADLILYVVDGSTNLDENDLQIFSLIEDKKAIILLNKTDLTLCTTIEMLQSETKQPIIPISAKKQQGIEDLEAVLKELFFQGELKFNDEVIITNIRHKTALMEALESIKQVKNSIKAHMSEDFYSIDLMNAYEVLGSILGESVEEDLVNTIFAQFCMGK